MNKCIIFIWKNILEKFQKIPKILIVQNFKNLYKHKILISIYEECNTKSTMSKN